MPENMSLPLEIAMVTGVVVTHSVFFIILQYFNVKHRDIFAEEKEKLKDVLTGLKFGPYFEEDVSKDLFGPFRDTRGIRKQIETVKKLQGRTDDLLVEEPTTTRDIFYYIYYGVFFLNLLYPIIFLSELFGFGDMIFKWAMGVYFLYSFIIFVFATDSLKKMENESQEFKTKVKECMGTVNTVKCFIQQD